MFEECKNLLNNVARTQIHQKGKDSYAQRAKETEVHIERIRKRLLASETAQKA
jgi:hypothetical protein